VCTYREWKPSACPFFMETSSLLAPENPRVPPALVIYPSHKYWVLVILPRKGFFTLAFLCLFWSVPCSSELFFPPPFDPSLPAGTRWAKDVSFECLVTPAFRPSREGWVGLSGTEHPWVCCSHDPRTFKDLRFVKHHPRHCAGVPSLCDSLF